MLVLNANTYLIIILLFFKKIFGNGNKLSYVHLEYITQRCQKDFGHSKVFEGKRGKRIFIKNIKTI
jgi:hypothetical protein